MEVIRLSGYTEEEKLRIAQAAPHPEADGGERHQRRRNVESHRRRRSRAIITGYTKEAGLRNLEREIGTICRKVAVQVARGQERRRATASPTPTSRSSSAPMKHFAEELLERDQVGVATGLAWTAVGGDILFIEALAVPRQGQARR